MPDFTTITKRLKPKDGEAQPPGRFSFGTQLQGGPRYTDPFGARPGPSLAQLVENYSALIYAMVARNRNAVARLPLRLLADGSRVQGKPSRACDPIKVSRSVGIRLAEAGAISSAAVDQVYEVRNHPLLDVLDNPDPYGTFTREKLIGLMVSYMDVIGSGFLVPEGNGWDWKISDKPIRPKGPPDYLWVIYPQYTIPVRAAASPIVSTFQYFGDRLPYDAVIWLRHNHSLRDAYGASFSPTYAGEPYRKQEQEQIAILSQVLGIGPRPNSVISAKDPLMPPGRDEAEALKQDLIRQHSAGMAGGVLINTGAWDWNPISYSPADLAGNEVGKQDCTYLAAIFDQPPTYYTVESNIANLEAADRQHDAQGVQPRCRTIEGSLTQLARRFDPRLSFKFDPGLREDEESKMKVVEMRLKNGLTTPNQENEEGQWPAFPEGDEHWIDGSRKTMSMLLEAHAQQLEQGKAEMDSMGTQDDLAVEGQDHSQKMAEKTHGHQKEVDKKKLAIEAQKAKQAKAKQERAIMDLAESVLTDVQNQLEVMRAG